MADNDLKFRLNFDIDPMERGLDEADARLRQSFKFLGKASTDLTKKWKEVATKAEKNWKKMRLNTDLETREIRDLSEAVTVTGKQVEWLSRIQARAATEDIARTKERLRAYGDWGDEIVKVMESQRKEGESELDVLSKITSEMKTSTDTAKESLNELRRSAFGKEGMLLGDAIKQLEEEAQKTRDEMTKSYFTYKAGKDIGEAAKEAISSLSGRDLVGAGKGLAKVFSASMKGTGAGLARWGMKKKEDANAGGMAKAMGGMAMKIGMAMGKTDQQMSKVMGKIGWLVEILEKFVKLMVDAESTAKEFNRDLLEGASTAEFLASAGGDASKAYADLEDTVTQIRKAATDVSENMDLGISKKTHLEFLDTLKQEGVSFHRIGKDAKIAGESTKDFSAEMVHVGVTYSRNFGVSLSEIGALQGELMRDMGLGLDSVKEQFAMMQNAASESGIAANKFFAIMRGMSADLSLFNLRLEEAAGIMKALSKSMSPKNAEALLKTLTNFYKGMGLQERIKAVRVGGVGKTKERLQKTLDARITAMSNDVAKRIGGGMDAETVQKAIKGGPESLKKFLAENQKSFGQEGMQSMTEAMYDAQRMQAKLTRGGLVDVASALKDASPLDVMGQIEDIAKNITGKKLEDLKDADLLAASTVAGVSDEQIDQLIKAKRGIGQVRANLTEQLKKGYNTLSDEQKELADKLGINGDKAEDIAKAEKVTNEEIWANMTDLQKKALQGGESQADYAKQQVDLTQSIGNKLDLLMDAIMESVYESLKDLIDDLGTLVKLIATKFGEGGVETNKRKAVREAKDRLIRSKDPTALAILKATKEEGGLSKALANKFDAAKKETEKLQSEGKQGWDAVGGTIKDAMQTMWQKTADPKEQKTLMASALMKAGIKGDPMKNVMKALDDGKGMEDALRASGLTAEQITEVGKGMAGEVGKMDPALLIEMAKYMQAFKEPDKKKAAEPPKTTGEKPPSPQTQASAPPGTKPAAAPGAPAPGQPPATRTGQTVAAPPGALDAKQPPAVKETAEAAAETASSSQETADLLAAMNSKNGEIVKVLLGKTGKGVVLGAPKGDGFGKVIEKSVLKAVQQALFEYWIYKDDKRDKAKLAEIAQYGGGKISADANRQRVAAWATREGYPMEDNAAGGMVAGTAGGLARVVRAAPGEGLASVGKGERIVPAGGGGGTIKVELAFKDGMEKFVEAKVIDTNYEHTRRSRTS